MRQLVHSKDKGVEPMLVPCDEAAYREFMERKVKPFLESSVTGSQFESFDGAKIQYYCAVQENARASVVIVHGFTEYFAKFHELFYNFYDQGCNVFFIEQRGHGLSARMVENKDLVHVDSFETYVKDLQTFLDQIVVKSSENLPLLLYAHSMGGCVGALFLEEHPEYFKAALLSSPMLKMYFGDVKNWQADLLAKTSKVLGWEKRPMPGYVPFDPEHPDFENSCALSKARYDYFWEMRLKGDDYTMCSGTYGWCVAALDATKKIAENAPEVKIPVLICQAGKDTMVDNEGQNIFARRAKQASIRRFPGAKHEIYNSTGTMLRDYEDTVFGFYNKVLTEMA